MAEGDGATHGVPVGAQLSTAVQQVGDGAAVQVRWPAWPGGHTAGMGAGAGPHEGGAALHVPDKTQQAGAGAGVHTKVLVPEHDGVAGAVPQLGGGGAPQLLT